MYLCPKKKVSLRTKVNQNNDEMKKYPNANLPIGKYYMSTYRHALKQYIQFSDDVTSNKQ